MYRPGRVTPVAKAVRHAFEQAYPACLLAQYQDTGVRRDLTAVEGGEHHPFAEIRKAGPENALFYRSSSKSTLSQ